MRSKGCAVQNLGITLITKWMRDSNGFNKHLQKRRIFLFFRDWSGPPVLTSGKHPKV